MLTPNALAAGDVSEQAKKFMVVMNAATSIITTKSQYMIRTSLTTPQLNDSLGQWAYRNGIRKIYTMSSDFGPGIDADKCACLLRHSVPHFAPIAASIPSEA